MGGNNFMGGPGMIGQNTNLGGAGEGDDNGKKSGKGIDRQSGSTMNTIN